MNETTQLFLGIMTLFFIFGLMVFLAILGAGNWSITPLLILILGPIIWRRIEKTRQ